MAFSLVAHTAANLGTNGGTTSGIDTTGAKLIVMGVSSEVGVVPTVSDSKSNSWRAIPANSVARSAYLFYAYGSLTVGSGHTFTVTSSGGSNSAAVAAFSGYTGTVDPFNATNQHAQTSGSSVASGSITPSSNNQVVLTAYFLNLAAGTVSVDSSLTITDTVQFSSGVAYGVSLAYIVQTTAGAVNATWSRTLNGAGTNNNMAIIASFRPDGTFSTGSAGGAYAFC